MVQKKQEELASASARRGVGEDRVKRRYSMGERDVERERERARERERERCVAIVTD